MLLAESDDLIEHLRHPVIESGIMGLLADDRAAHVVFDGLLDRFFVAARLAKALVDGLSNTRLNDQLQQADFLEGRDLAWLIRFNVGINQEAHVGLVGLEVQIFPCC